MNENPSEPLLGLDVRTPGSMGVLARTDDEVVATSDQPHEPSLPHGGRTEHESDEVWWKDFVAIFGELPEEADGPIAAVAQRRRSMLFGHWRDRETTWSSMANTVEPNPANRQIHDELYAVYKDLYSATRPITYPLTDLRTRWGDPLEVVAK
jgi:sugar (pentulose or hexulose) kinase